LIKKVLGYRIKNLRGDGAIINGIEAWIALSISLLGARVKNITSVSAVIIEVKPYLTTHWISGVCCILKTVKNVRCKNITEEDKLLIYNTPKNCSVQKCT
jgi:hypothetical protein